MILQQNSMLPVVGGAVGSRNKAADASQTSTTNRRIVLHSRPVGAPVADNFRMLELPIPVPSAGQIVLRTIWLSLDPYMRGRMSDGPSYAPPVSLGDAMVGATVSRVHVSRHPNFEVGDWVLAACGWQDYALSNGTGLTRLDHAAAHPSLSLGVLGMPGFTGFMGLTDIGRPKAGETVVVAAASGAVGSVVGQVARLHGCRAVGVAGGREKCDYVVNELRFDACIDHRDPAFPALLAAACDKGIDVYFESVGGAVFDAVLPLLNTRARIPLCGLIAHYNDAGLPQGPDRSALLMRTMLTKRISMRGFMIFQDYGDRFGEFVPKMQGWLDTDEVRYREDVVEGLGNAPEKFLQLLEGKNFGKVVVRVASD